MLFVKGELPANSPCGLRAPPTLQYHCQKIASLSGHAQNPKPGAHLRGYAWRQKPQKYHAKSLEALRAKYNAVKDRSALDAILDKAAVRQGLTA